jgi:hypothetical protein
MFNNKIKKTMQKEGINTTEDANRFMDKIVNKLDDKSLYRAYTGAKEKHNKKQNNNTKYMVDYFYKKLQERGIKI